MQEPPEFGVCDICLSSGDVFLLDCKCGRAICADCAAEELKCDVTRFSQMNYLELKCTDCILMSSPACWYCGGHSGSLIGCSCFVAFHEKCAMEYGIKNCPLHYCWTCRRALQQKVFCCYICLRSFHEKCDGIAMIIDEDDAQFCACVCIFCCERNKINVTKNLPSIAKELRGKLQREPVALSNANALFEDEVYIERILSFFTANINDIIESCNSLTALGKTEIIQVFYRSLRHVFSVEQQMVLYSMLKGPSLQELNKFAGGIAEALAAILDLFFGIANLMPLSKLANSAIEELFDGNAESFAFQLDCELQPEQNSEELNSFIAEAEKFPLFQSNFQPLIALLHQRILFIRNEYLRCQFRLTNPLFASLLQEDGLLKELQPFFGILALKSQPLFELERLLEWQMLTIRFGSDNMILCVGEEEHTEFVEEWVKAQKLDETLLISNAYRYQTKIPIKPPVPAKEIISTPPVINKRPLSETESSTVEPPNSIGIATSTGSIAVEDEEQQRQSEESAKDEADLEVLGFLCYFKCKNTNIVSVSFIKLMIEQFYQEYARFYQERICKRLCEDLEAYIEQEKSGILQETLERFELDNSKQALVAFRPFGFLFEHSRQEGIRWNRDKVKKELAQHVDSIFKSPIQVQIEPLMDKIERYMVQYQNNINWNFIQFIIFVDSPSKIVLKAIKYSLHKINDVPNATAERDFCRGEPEEEDKSIHSNANGLAKMNHSPTVNNEKGKQAIPKTNQLNRTDNCEQKDGQSDRIPADISTAQLPDVVKEQGAVSSSIPESTPENAKSLFTKEQNLVKEHTGQRLPEKALKAPIQKTAAMTENRLSKNAGSLREQLINAVEQKRREWRWQMTKQITKIPDVFVYPVYESAVIAELELTLKQSLGPKPAPKEFVISNEELPAYTAFVYKSEE